MFRKLFWISSILGVYFWIVSARDEEDIHKIWNMITTYAEYKWKELDLSVHVHSPGCRKYHKR